MTRTARILLITLFAFSTVASFTQSKPDLPRVIRYTGTLKNADGTARTGTVGVTFAIYSTQDAASPLWQEVQNVAVDETGHFSVLLGAAKADGLPAELFATNDARWLGIRIESEQEQPRTILAAVPYAMKAGDAETLGGKPLSAFVLNDNASNGRRVEGAATSTADATGTPSNSRFQPLPTTLAGVSGTGTANYVTKWTDGAGTLGNSLIYDNGTNVGIGTTSPLGSLHVYGANAPSSGGSSITGDLILQGIGGTFGGAMGSYDNGVQQYMWFQGRYTDSAVYRPIVLNPSGGNIGIGTSTPLGTLHIQGPNAVEQGQSAVNGAFIIQGSGTFSGAMGTYDNGVPGGQYMWIQPRYMDNAVYRDLVLNPSAGNVGIGTTTTTAKLTVNGGVTAAGVISGSNINANGTSTFSGVPSGSGVGQGPLYVNPASAGAGTTLFGVAVNGTSEFKVDASGNVAAGGALTTTRLALPSTTTSTLGVITQNGTPVFHTYGTGNTFAGASTGNFTTTGQNNSAFGNGLMATLTSGNANTALGSSTLPVITSQGNDTAVGALALENATSGLGQNTAVGAFGLNALTTGSDNAALGVAALYSTTIGTKNTGIGDFALESNTTGSQNVAVGTSAGYTSTIANANTTGSNNTFVGYNSGPGTSTQLNNATAIGANALVSASNALVLGSGVNVGIGTATPAYKLDVEGGVAFASTGLYTNGSVSLNNATGSDGFIGVLRLGGSPFMHAYGTNGTYLGTSAGNFTNTGNWSVGIGTTALASLTSGQANTGVGYNALTTVSTGSNNTGLGAAALLTDSTGVSNTGIGQNALSATSTGSYNTAVGAVAGWTNDFANANQTGSYNTFIGFASGPGTNTQLTNATALGANALVSENNAVILGDSTTSIRVGVGTNTPSFAIHVSQSDTSGTGIQIRSTNTATTSNSFAAFSAEANNGGAITQMASDGLGTGPLGTAGGYIGTYTSHPLGFVTANVVRMFVTSAGNVGVGTSSPSDKVHVNGELRVNSCVKNSGGTAIAGTCSSDVRLKKNIAPFSPMLAKVAKLQPVYFDWRADEFPEYHFGSERSYGLIAQDVAAVLPELVGHDEHGMNAVNYSKLPLVTLQALRELKEENDSLRQELKDLRGEIEELKALVLKHK